MGRTFVTKSGTLENPIRHRTCLTRADAVAQPVGACSGVRVEPGIYYGQFLRKQG